MADTYGAGLFDQHAEMLAASGIPPEHAQRRGYVSVDTKKRLESAGVTKAGRRIPGLLVPSLRKDGSTWGWQYRADRPAEGRQKYETPTGQRNGIDVPPGIGPLLDDPAVPLFVTEGVKKADAGAVRGLACIALPGVWSWRGKNANGGKTAVPDWHDVALNGRRVILAFDSDVTTKSQVRKALDELARYLGSKEATIEYAHLPDLGDGKCGLDDYLAENSVDELWTRVRPDPPETVPDGTDEPPSAEAATPAPVPDGTPAFNGDPAALLDQIAAWFRRYLAVPSEHHITALTLWAAHTWMVEAFYVTPRLIVDSAEPESGKTRVLELLNLICQAPILTMNTTIAALYRRLDGASRTVLLDETDAVFAKGAAQNHEDLRALLNAGYKRGATVDRCVGEGSKMEVKEFPAFAPAALAGIYGNMPDTITSRAVTLSMRRRSPDEQIAEFIEEDVLAEAEPLRVSLEAWAADVVDKIRGARPVMPDGVRDRKAEVWRALLGIADAAGGDWPEKSREACRHFALETSADDASIGVRLLTDLFAVFRDGHDLLQALSTETILSRLNAMEEAPWPEWRGKPFSARNLSNILKRYRDADGNPLKSKAVRIGDEVVKGYRRADLWDSWSRYGILATLPTTVTSVTSVTALARGVTDVTDVTHTGGEVAEASSEPTVPENPDTQGGACPSCGYEAGSIEHEMNCEVAP